jgi:hypothetical protein
VLKQLQLNADVCRTNAKLAYKSGNDTEAAQWKLAAQQIEAAIRTIKIASITRPQGEYQDWHTLNAKDFLPK